MNSNIVIDHGCEWREAWQWIAKGGPVDGTGGELKGEIRAEPDGALLGAFSFTWTDQERFEFEAAVAASDANAIPDGIHRYDWIYTDSNGRPTKLRGGRATKQGTITNLS